MMLKRIAMLSVHTSPLAPMGGKKTGGMNVYIRELARELGSQGIQVDIFTRRSSHDEAAIEYGIGENVRLIYIDAGAVQPLSPDDIYPYVSEFAARTICFAMRDGVQYDLIYSHYWLSGAVAITLKESWGTPFVQMFHTLGHMKQRILNNTDNYPGTRIATETRIVEWADRIIAATPAELTQLRWLYRANRRKIEIIPPGVNIGRFAPGNNDVEKQDIHSTLVD
ncbi:MAG: glycosyltransferase, partial [Aggregatilineales bacterium]